MAATHDAAAATLGWGASDELNGLEAVMWRAEADPRLRSTIVAVEVLDRAPDWERFLAAHERGSRLVPRFRKRVEDPGLGPLRWVWDEHFELRYHVRRQRLPEGAVLQDALDEAARIAMAPFERHRSPWEAHLLEGLPDGRAAYVLKMHHSSTDGIGGMQLLGGLHSRTREPSGLPMPPSPLPEVREPRPCLLGTLAATAGADARSLAGRAGGALRRARRPDRTVREAVEAVRSLQRTLGDPGVPGSPLLAPRSLTWRFIALEVPFADLRAASKAGGGSLNDAYLAGLLGGLRRFHEAMGAEVPEALPLAIPINVRKEGDEAGGNAFAAAKLAGPLAERDPVARMAAVGAQVRSARSEPALDALRHVTPLLGRLPGPVIAKLAGGLTLGNDVQASNVPGLREDVFLAGAKVERMLPFAPLPGCAAMVTMVTHGSTCCIGANLDGAAFPDAALVRRCLQEGFDEVLALTPV